MAVLVTGGAGYIGSHTCVELLRTGEEIVVLDNHANSKPGAIRRIRELAGRDFTFHKADLLDETFLRKIFSQNDIESVIHFAGFKAVGESVQKPLSYYRNNIASTVSLCQIMVESGCKRFVFSSSSTVYGISQDVPFTEDLPLSATNPYGWTKLMSERILQDVHVANPEWSIALLRYFNPIGADKSGLLGEDPQGIPNNLLPYIAQVAVGKLKELSVYGNDYATVDGTGVRDYLHVSDLATGHRDALKFIRSTKGIEAINLGTGKGYSVLEVIRAFEKASGKTVAYKIAPRRAGDIAICYADAGKAKRLLGWEATQGIDEMCADSWNFVQKNPHGIQ